MDSDKIREAKAQQYESLGEKYKAAYISAYRASFDVAESEKGFSRTKGIKATLNYMFIVPLIGWAIAKYTDTPPDIFKSEVLKKAERNADKEGAKAAYKLAVKNGLQGEALAPFAKIAKTTEVYANESKERHSATIGTLFGAALGIAAFVVLGPVGVLAAICFGAVAAAAGFIYDQNKDNEAIKRAESAGKSAALDAKEGKILPIANIAPEQTKTNAPQQATPTMQNTEQVSQVAKLAERNAQVKTGGQNMGAY